MTDDRFVKDFCKTVNKMGEGYQNQGVELIKICRVLSLASKQTPDQDRRLQRVLRTCDIAIKKSAVMKKSLGSKVRGEIEQSITEAVRELLEYKRDFHLNNDRIKPGPQMETAKKEDKKSSKKRIENKDNRSVVHFHILRSFPDPKPIIARQVLISSFELADILWNFSLVYNDRNDDENDKQLPVAQNPHFYLNLPTLVNGTYQGGPVAELTQPYPGTVYVLTNNERRVYLEFGEEPRAFDRVWKTNDDALSFKDIIGRLESETTVEGEPPFIWFHMKPPNFVSERGGEIGNWGAPIRRHWGSPDTHIHIKEKKK